MGVPTYAVNCIEAELREQRGSLLGIHTGRLAPCRYNSPGKMGFTVSGADGVLFFYPPSFTNQ